MVEPELPPGGCFWSCASTVGKGVKDSLGEVVHSKGTGQKDTSPFASAIPTLY